MFFNEACLTYSEYNLFLNKYRKAAYVFKQIAVFRKNTVGIDLLEIEWNYLDAIGTDAFEELKKFNAFNFSIEKYQNAALDKWDFFVEKVLKEKDVIYILDSSIFQFQIWKFLLNGIEYDRLKELIEKLVKIIEPLNPKLIYFYRENVEESILALEKMRGVQCMKNIWERDKMEPYYKGKAEGADGVKLFLKDYADIACKLFCSIDCGKLAVEITKQDWISYEQRILSFMGLEYKESINAFPTNGVYINEQMDLKVEINGLNMKDPNGKIRRLIPKSSSEFYVECLPVIIQFNELGNVIILGGQICERWTMQGTIFIKI